MSEDNDKPERTGFSVRQETKDRLMEDRTSQRSDGGLGVYTPTWDDYLNTILDQAQAAREEGLA